VQRMGTRRSTMRHGAIWNGIHNCQSGRPHAVPAIGQSGRVDQASHLSPGLSGALRTFGYWIANGTLGLPLLEGIDYWSVMRVEPSLMEQTLAIFANVLMFGADGNPTNAKHAERR
jgi:hypothetical protein